jgi:hypothetical protein
MMKQAVYLSSTNDMGNITLDRYAKNLECEMKCV